jgi:hypothetical protein
VQFLNPIYSADNLTALLSRDSEVIRLVSQLLKIIQVFPEEFLDASVLQLQLVETLDGHKQCRHPKG